MNNSCNHICLAKNEILIQKYIYGQNFSFLSLNLTELCQNLVRKLHNFVTEKDKD